MITCGRDLTRLNEGLTLVAKPDAKGQWVIGRGHDIPAPKVGEKPPVCTEADADKIFEIDYTWAEAGARRDVGVVIFDELVEPRQAVLVDIAFEIGRAGLAGFHKLIAAVAHGDWSGAALEIHNSKLFAQVEDREARNMDIMMNGAYPAE